MNSDFLKNNPTNIFSILFAFFPFSFFLGNTIINLNILFIILFYFIFLKKLDLKIYSLCFVDKIIIFYFFYVLLVCTINIIENYFLLNFTSSKTNLFVDNFGLFEYFYNKNNFYILFKSIFYLRFLILYFIIRILLNKNLIKVNWFILSASFCSIFVIFDIFFQYYFQVNIFGIHPVHPRKLSGIFGEELIAGSYIQKFSIFLIFSVILFFKEKYNFFYFSIFVIIIIFSILLTGNRFPLILFLFSTFLMLFFQKKNFKKLLIFTILAISFFLIGLKNNEIKINYFDFKNQVVRMAKNFTNNSSKNIHQYNQYYYEFLSAFETWKINKYFGGGLRSFRINCPIRKEAKGSERLNCNTHPHNYYLELLTDLGLIGTVIFSYLIIYIFYIFYKNFFLKKEYFRNPALPFACILFAEMFPVRSSGSFFSNSNAFIIFLLISFTIGLIKKKQ